ASSGWGRRACLGGGCRVPPNRHQSPQATHIPRSSSSTPATHRNQQLAAPGPAPTAKRGSHPSARCRLAASRSSLSSSDIEGGGIVLLGGEGFERLGVSVAHHANVKAAVILVVSPALHQQAAGFEGEGVGGHAALLFQSFGRYWRPHNERSWEL